jgi:hypothetical protein
LYKYPWKLELERRRKGEKKRGKTPGIHVACPFIFSSCLNIF